MAAQMPTGRQHAVFHDVSKREIGDEAVWSLSSAKPGNGAQELRDKSVDSFWQSNGNSPHLINLEFRKATVVTDVALYSVYKLDESYTPAKVTVRAGSSFHDLRQVAKVTFEEPDGWEVISLSQPLEDGSPPPEVKVHLLQIAIVSSHQNGRDTHVRQVCVYGPRASRASNITGGLSEFTTTEFSQFSGLR